ncbi:hypothetical protein Gasu2_55510 [Galdieria sulphuraria]|uniref:Uncharacterized protein n=1 Tax=Galdieria sulphuraria TaxID=130081 RepID=M2WYS6_GALSU|nr:uncharacterized protein Gasu_34110 [Galdieria sulphuraria]EME29210.1 hypothetical protein Gasu_34110 [Galdieria sulphuraria]GJD11412.1 hypothetical protein Gasu2_55510 [Galdieria sulphuraria]|eukprot:XP_005705730.1 hypothetical protein Gasu_34110 [Galdieria sulphuraria]
MGKGKKQKEKKVVSLAEFNASMGLDPLKPLELQSLPTAPKGDNSENQRDFSKVRREGGRGFRKEDESGDGRRKPTERKEANGFRDLDWSQARQGKPVEKEADLRRRAPTNRDVDFSSARQGSQVIGEDAVEAKPRQLDKKGERVVDRDFALRRREVTDDDSKQEKDFSNLRKKEPISQVQRDSNSSEREVDFSSVRSGASVIESVTDSFQPKKNREVDFGNVRKMAQPIAQSVRDTSERNANVDFSNARSGSHVIASVSANRQLRSEDSQAKDHKPESKRSSQNRPQSGSRDVDFSKLRIRE